jgi:hypothetical protein
MMMTTPVFAGDNGNGQGRGGRNCEDCSRGHNGDNFTSIIQVENKQLLTRRGNDCDHTHTNEKAGNDNGNGNADDNEVG